MTRQYDERGSQTEAAYFGVDGMPILSALGCAGTAISYSYDELHKPIKLVFFGTDGKPILGKYGIASATIAYDGEGNIHEVEYFGIDGKPIVSNDGVASMKRKYVRGNITEEAVFGIDKKPIIYSEGGFARLTIDYDEHGNVRELVCMGANGMWLSANTDSRARPPVTMTAAI